MSNDEKIKGIQRAVCEVWGVEVGEILGRSREPGVCDARHVSLAFCHLALCGTHEAIAAEHGGRSAFSVPHAMQRCSDLRDTDRGFARKWHAAETKLKEQNLLGDV